MTNNTTTHTPINLRPGLDLMVSAGYADDPTTLELVAKCKALLDRATHVEEIESELRWLVAGDDLRGLDLVLEMTGWLNNLHNSTAAHLAAGVLALLPTVDDARIIEVAKVATFHGDALRARTRGESDELDAKYNQLCAAAKAVQS